MRKLTCRAACLALSIWALAAAGAAARPTTPFFAIHDERITVPTGVQPWLPTFVDHGSEILFQNQRDGTTWITTKTGRDPHCITCSFHDRPNIVGGFSYEFPDGKRLFISHEIGADGGDDSPSDADAYVLQCAPSVWKCTSHRYLPVDMSADKGSEYIVQRRTWHLSPDGRYLGWTDLRIDGMLMIVARLRREADRYVAADPRIVDPKGPTGPDDTSPTAWSNYSQMYELKSFVDGGRSILALAEPNGDPDVIKIDLRTGRVTRLTSNPDWDEDGALSPDGKLEAVYSWRTRNRISATGWIPQIPNFIGLDAVAGLAPYYVSTWPGFQCDLSPWLLPGTGDGSGRLIGQPLQTYAGNLTAGNNLSGQQFWSPESNAVLLQERLRTRPPAGANAQVAQKGLVPRFIMVAKIARAATTPQRAVSSAVGSWAPAAATYRGPAAADHHVVVHARRGGTATITFQGSLAAGSMSVVFKRYTTDGRTFVSGTEFAGDPNGDAQPWVVRDNVTVSGAHTGRLTANLVIDNGHKPLPKLTGSYSAVYDGRAAPRLPKLGACYSKLPTRNPLALSARRQGAKLVVTVTADIDGDRRPVSGATITTGRGQWRSNRYGRVKLTLPVGRHPRIVATAGNTFQPRTLVVR